MADVIPLTYTRLEFERSSRDRVVLRLGCVGAAMLAVLPCLTLLELPVAVYLQMMPPAISQWIGALLRPALGLVLVACAIVFGRAIRKRTPLRSLRWWSAATFAAALGLGAFERLRWIMPGGAVGGSGWLTPVLQSAEVLVEVLAALLCLLIPALLLETRSPGAWRRRALMLGAVTAFAVGLAGVQLLIRDGQRIQSFSGGTLGQCIQMALQQPAPLLGLWRLGGFIACVLFVIALVEPQRITTIAGAIVGIGFVVLVSDVIFEARSFGWQPRGGNKGLYLYTTVVRVIEALQRTVTTALPFVLLLWASSRDAEHLLDGTQAAPAEDAAAEPAAGAGNG